MSQDPFRARQRATVTPEPPPTPAPVVAETPERESAPDSAPVAAESVETHTADPFDPSWPIARLVAWAGKDPGRIEAVLAAEAAKTEPRQSLWLRMGRRHGG